MDLGIAGKTALVHGAGGGLGGAIALALAQEGVKVAVCDVNADALTATVERIRSVGGSSYAQQWDLADIDGFAGRLEQVEANLGPVDILVNNTGGPPPGTAHGVAPQDWEKHFRQMVLSVTRMTDLVLPGMRQRGWGRIITSASSGVIAPIPNLGLSNALRAALVGWSKTLAREVGPDGVTANILIPGRIATGRITALDEARAKREGRSVESVVEESTGSIPLKRYGRPEEYGSAAAFLASNHASYITGSQFRVDGGLIPSI